MLMRDRKEIRTRIELASSGPEYLHVFLYVSLYVCLHVCT